MYSGSEATDKLPGYEQVIGTDQIIIQPKKLDDPSIPPPTQIRTFEDIPFLSEEEARNGLEQFVKEKCCVSSAPIRTLVFTNMESSNTFRYALETFTETRTTQWASEPYSGQPISHIGTPPPGPWDINHQPTSMFIDSIHKIEVPGTARIDRCLSCNGIGFQPCQQCTGTGRKACTFCNGTGKFVSSRCTTCDGLGFKNCINCNSSGRTACQSCKGKMNLKWFIQLTITYKNNMIDYMKKTTADIPDDLLRNCQGKTILSEEAVRLSPITNYPDGDMNRASADLIQTHSSQFTDSRVLRQRQSIFTIPITACSYTYKSQNYKYYVYGLNQKVYHSNPEYPGGCCCTIL